MGHPSALPLDRTVEFAFEYDTTVPLAGQAECHCAPVRYRKVGSRRWTRFLLVADPGETLQSLDSKIEPAIYHLLAERKAA